LRRHPHRADLLAGRLVIDMTLFDDRARADAAGENRRADTRARRGQASEVASIVAFLASDEASCLEWT
jgi:hypothetical protein